MTKVSLQKQTKDLMAAAEEILLKIESANSIAKTQVIWLQDAEKNLKTKIKEEKLLSKQKEELEVDNKIIEHENIVPPTKEPDKTSLDNEKVDEPVLFEKEKEETDIPSDVKEKSKADEPKQESAENKAKEEKDTIKHKQSVVPIKKESNRTKSNIEEKKSHTTIINIDDRPKKPIGIRVVKRAPSPEELAEARKQLQIKRQSVKPVSPPRERKENYNPSQSNNAEKSRPNLRQQSAPNQRTYTPRPTTQSGGGIADNTFKTIASEKLPIRPNTRKKLKTSTKSTYQETPSVASKTKAKKGFEREASKKFVFGDDYELTGPRRKGPKKQNLKLQIEKVIIENAIINSKTITIKELAEKIGKPGAEIIKQLFKLGIMANINQSIDFDTAALVSSELGISLDQKIDKTNEEKMVAAHDDTIDAKNVVKRAPIVTVMGHVDHGKTSLLDAIRNTNVIQGEAGGITQHIGAYSIVHNGEPITFIDTPGHEAFTAMRARGAKVTDIAILVVAADDGVMPQTVEAINHAKAADVPIIVAINKMDVPGANPERVKQELTEYELLTEEWGGDTIMVPVSALKVEGIDKLLEDILLVAEIQELRADPNTSAKGTIIEAQLDIGRGPVATVLVQNGTLKVGDSIVAGTITGKVRAMIDDKGNKIEEAGPSTPVEVLGFSSVPEASAIMYVADERLSRKVAADRKSQIREDQTKSSQMVTLDDLFNKINEGKLKDLNIILKADVQGSAEAMKQSLLKLSNEEVRVNIKHSGVGAISESDVRLASASNAIIIGFNVRPDPKGRATAAEENVEIRTYRIIYKAIEDIEKAIKGMLQPIYKEEVIGHAEVRNVIKISTTGNIAGSYITDGLFTRNASARILRDSVIIYEGSLSSLRRFKDDVKEVKQGFECGIGIDNFNDIKEGDVIEAFTMKEVER